MDIATVTLNPAIDRTITISNFIAGAVHRVESSRDSPGGKGVNVASALADCGMRVAATGFLGRDNTALFEGLFEQKKIHDRFVRIAGSTRTGIKIVDPPRALTTDINYPGPAPTPADVTALHETLGELTSDYCVVAGSISPGLDSGIYRKIIASMKERGTRVVLDASGEGLRQGIEAAPNVVKPNLAEMEGLFGKRLVGPDVVIRAARSLLQKGIEMVVVSMGRQGACFVTATEALVARSEDVMPGSTVGAGDAMVAGIVAAQIRCLPLDGCARLASAFALHALTRGRYAPFTSAAIEAAMRQITVEKAKA